MFSFFTKAETKYEKVFFDFKINNINNEIVNLSNYKGKIVLLVNVASNCGFTNQYNDLQEVYDKYKEKNIESNNEETSFQTRFKLPIVNNKVQCNIYNKDREIIDIDELKSKNVIMILHFKGLKILKDSFSLECYINQIKEIDTKKYNILNNYAIIEDEEEDTIDENMFNEEIKEVLKLEQLEKEKMEKIKSEKLEQINKLKEELEKLEN